MIENKKKPNPIDIHVGSRIRLRRTMLGMSQEKLGEALGDPKVRRKLVDLVKSLASEPDSE
jgi:transcriptional regulator with XRE-family HTH domain